MAARANLDPSRNRKAGQRGIATLEFSLMVTMLLMFVCAVVGYGVLFLSLIHI